MKPYPLLALNHLTVPLSFTGASFNFSLPLFRLQFTSATKIYIAENSSAHKKHLPGRQIPLYKCHLLCVEIVPARLCMPGAKNPVPFFMCKAAEDKPPRRDRSGVRI